MQKMLARPPGTPSVRQGRTGKPSRQLVSDWTNAWAPNVGGRQPLPLPLQSMISRACAAPHRQAGGGRASRSSGSRYLLGGPGVGLMNKVKPAREVVLDFIEDYSPPPNG